MPQVRAAVLTNFDEVARYVGIDAVALLRASGIDPASLADRERMMPLAKAAEVLEGAALQSGCEHFGLLMAESRSLGSIGPMSLLLVHVPSIGDMIHAMVRHQRLLGDAMHLHAESVDDATLLMFEICGARETRQLAELALALFCRCMSTILRRPWSPESVHFPHPAPADLRVHRRAFSCPIDFDAGFLGIVCARDSLAECNPAGDEELAAHAEQLLALVLPPPVPRSVGERIARALMLLLPEQSGTIDRVALHIGGGRRSLQRQLHGEGQTFSGVLNEVRRELALRYLSASQPVAWVAQMTGYRDTSSFTRWFTAEFDMPPTEWRKTASKGGSAAEHGPSGRQGEFFAPASP